MDRATCPPYLENLALRAYLIVYGPSRSLWRSLGDFIRRGFPQAVRALGPHLAIAVLLLLAGTTGGFLLVRADSACFNLIIPAELAGGRGPDRSREELMQKELFAPWPGFIEGFIVFANALFRHNTVVGLLAFSHGFTLGLPTVFLLLNNGLILGWGLSCPSTPKNSSWRPPWPGCPFTA